MEPGNKFTNSELIQGLASGRRIVLEYLYDAILQQFKKYVSANGGQTDDAYEVFQNVLTGIYRRLKEDKLQIEKNPEAYILVSCKKEYIKKSERSKARDFIAVEENLDLETSEGLLENELKKEKYKIMWACLKEMSERCRKVIMHFSNGYSSAQIAEDLQLSSAAYARRIKGECMKKLKSKYFTRYEQERIIH